MKVAIMKTMKYIVLVCALIFSTALMANDNSTSSQMPTLPFESTSTMPLSGTQLPNASEDGVGIVSTPVTGPHRVNPGQKPADPFDDPVGDAILPLALLAAAYVLFLARKKRTAN
jgi:hypothetical protein